ncbi:hypothetical protein [Streptomyces sp. NBC_00827]|uniref:hypothetical protein n=1 Tax=Streptomyces sp. NBC_00827 TaxID=2903677 RepID=UPI00386EAA65|nr:hypothetical protein OG569_20170 [Streptomyces sp. NBC_00827]
MWRRRSLIIAAAAALSVSLFQPSVSADDAVGGAGAVEKQSVVAAASEPAESAPYEIPEYNPVPLNKGEEPSATPEPEDYADLRATGLRLMLEDLRNGDLKEEAFINHAYAKLGYQSKGVPARYRDDALTEGERIILGMAIGREIEKLPHPVRKSIQNRLAHAKDLQRFLKEDPKDDLTDGSTEESTDESAVGQSASAQESSGDVSVLAAPVECGGFLPAGVGGAVVFDCAHQMDDFVIFYNIEGSRSVDPDDDAVGADLTRGDIPENGVPNYIDRLDRSFRVALTKFHGLGYEEQDPDQKIAVLIGSRLVDRGVGFVPPPQVAGANVIHIGGDFNESGLSSNEFYLPRHELFHVMQYKHIDMGTVFNVRGVNAWMEATAEWAAHQALQDDLAHVPATSATSYASALKLFFERPEQELTHQDSFGKNLDEGEGRQYGAFIFAEFLEERLGAQAIRRTWERIGDSWFPDAASQIEDMIEDDFGGDPYEEFRVFGVANYQLCGGSTAADYGSYWRYQDADVSEWCTRLSGSGSDATFPVARPKHETIALPADGKASGAATVEDGGVHYVDLVGQKDPSKLWNMAVRTMQDDDRRLTFTVVNWERIPKRCYADDKSARAQDATIDTRIGGDTCYVATLMISHGDLDEEAEEGRWETAYTSLFGGAVGGTDVEIGVQPGGNLITPGGSPSAGTRTTEVGLRYKPTNIEAVSAVACHCEGWGIQVTPPGGVGQWSGWSHGVHGLSANAEIVSFTTTPTTATSIVRLVGTDYPVYVQHDFRPSSRPELYDVEVTITSLAPEADVPHITYRRVVDWDVEPTPTEEYVTVKADHENVEFASDYGLAGPDPASGRPVLHNSGSFTDAGPYDQGTVFDLNVPLADIPGPETWVEGSFHLYYGAAPSQDKALEALAAVGAPVYSLAKPNTPGNPGSGSPSTFVLGYKPVS